MCSKSSHEFIQEASWMDDVPNLGRTEKLDVNQEYMVLQVHQHVFKNQVKENVVQGKWGGRSCKLIADTDTS